VLSELQVITSLLLPKGRISLSGTYEESGAPYVICVTLAQLKLFLPRRPRRSRRCDGYVMGRHRPEPFGSADDSASSAAKGVSARQCAACGTLGEPNQISAYLIGCKSTFLGLSYRVINRTEFHIRRRAHGRFGPQLLAAQSVRSRRPVLEALSSARTPQIPQARIRGDSDSRHPQNCAADAGSRAEP
jgi:hypothetical protein